MKNIDIGLLANGPHAKLILDLANKCSQDASVEAVWVGGSLASGTGDVYSDIDFRIAVDPSQMEKWQEPDWNLYLPLSHCGGTFLQFGDHALLHHLVLIDGTIVDFYVQDTSIRNPEPEIVVILCRNELFAKVLAELPTAPKTMITEINAEAARQLFVDYWIATHKQMKALARKYDYSPFVGLYFEKVALLRALHMEVVGKDIDARVSIHMLGALHKGLNGKLTKEQQDLLGLPSRIPEETVIAIEATRKEMSRIGHLLSKKHGFEYPQELEEVALKTWSENKQAFMKR